MLVRLLVVCGLFWGMMHTAFAEPGEAVLNDPPGVVSVLKDAITRLNPSYETVWDLYNGEFAQGMSANLYTVTSREIPIISVRAGASTGMALYSGVSLDLPGLSQRFIPASVKGMATTGPLDTLWGFVGKYARVGVIGGYSWDHHDPVIGFTAGAALTF